MRLLVSLVSSLGFSRKFLAELTCVRGPILSGPRICWDAGVETGSSVSQPNRNQKKPDEPVLTSMSRVNFSCKSQLYTERQPRRLKNELISCFLRQLRRLSQLCIARLLWVKLVNIGCYLSRWLLICSSRQRKNRRTSDGYVRKRPSFRSFGSRSAGV